MSDVLTTFGQESLVVPKGIMETLDVVGQETLSIIDETLELIEKAEQGPPGPPGIGGGGVSVFYTFPADGDVSGHRVMRVSQGKATICYLGDAQYAHNIIGISTNAAVDGDPVNIQHSGEMNEPSWDWDESRPIFMGNGGILTQAVSTIGFSLIVASVVTPTKIIVGIREPIVIVQTEVMP